MVRVDIIGPIGAGKTTFQREMLRSSVLTGSLKRSVSSRNKKKEIVLSSLSSPERLAVRLLCLQKSLEKKIIFDPISEEGWRSVSEWSGSVQEFVQYVLRNAPLSEVNLQDSCRRISWFVRDVADWALIKAHSSQELVIFDEGLTYRAVNLAIGLGEGDKKSFLQKYLTLYPLPDCVVYLNPPGKSLRERVKTRNGKQHRLLKYIDETINGARYACEVLDRLKVPIITVNATRADQGATDAVWREIKAKL